jgi:hypothetical protein
MTRPVTRDIVDLLIAAGVGSFDSSGESSGDWPIRIGGEPDRPNEVITLFDTAGAAPNPKFLLDFPRFSVRVRATDYDQAYAKAEEIKGAILGLPSQDLNGIRYIGIYCVLDTFHLKADEKGRHIFVNTWRIIREPVEGEHRQPL